MIWKGGGIHCKIVLTSFVAIKLLRVVTVSALKHRVVATLVFRTDPSHSTVW